MSGLGDVERRFAGGRLEKQILTRAFEWRFRCSFAVARRETGSCQAAERSNRRFGGRSVIAIRAIHREQRFTPAVSSEQQAKENTIGSQLEGLQERVAAKGFPLKKNFVSSTKGRVERR